MANGASSVLQGCSGLKPDFSPWPISSTGH